MPKVDLVEENAKHIEIINSELGSVKEEMAIIKTDIKWIKREFERMSGSMITIALTLVGAFISKIIGMW